MKTQSIRKTRWRKKGISCINENKVWSKKNGTEYGKENINNHIIKNKENLRNNWGIINNTNDFINKINKEKNKGNNNKIQNKFSLYIASKNHHIVKYIKLVLVPIEDITIKIIINNNILLKTKLLYSVFW